jgi:hypothetical protein
MPAIPVPDLIATLAALVSAMLTTCKVHLYTSIANPIGPNSVLGDFTEATFVGYAAKVSAFGAPYLNAGGQAVSDSPLLQWQPTANTTPNVVLGFYVTDSGGTTLLFCGPLPTPQNMVLVTDALPLVLQYVLQPPSPPY